MTTTGKSSREQTDKFLKEKISILDGLMRAGGHTHLILAGNHWETARLREALPKRLTSKVIDILPISGNEQIPDVVAATLSRFINAEEQESQAIAETLQAEILGDGLAVIGTQSTLNALRSGQVDVLVLAKSYRPDPGWYCAVCSALTISLTPPLVCRECKAANFNRVDLREELVRLAEQHGASVEVVQQSDRLMQLGGVGALLRYWMAQAGK